MHEGQQVRLLCIRQRPLPTAEEENGVEVIQVAGVD
jgi:hypothetical protein